MVQGADHQSPISTGTNPVPGWPFVTPRQLVEALHQRDQSARQRFWELLRPALSRLIDRLVAQHQLTGQRDRLLLHALHAGETWLRTRPLQDFDQLGWQAFQGAVLLQVAKMALHPFGQPTAVPTTPQPAPLPLPASPDYQTRTVFLPSQQLGDAWFGGDWYGGEQSSDGSLWLLLADITGHGYHAYLLASAMPNVWQKCWAAGRPGRQPADLLVEMHQLLVDCFPEGVYVEATLVRLTADGEVTVAPAGGSRLLLHRSGAPQADLISLRGNWLGLAPPSLADQHCWSLQPDDELVLATDGLFDQLAILQEQDLPDLGMLKETALFDQLQQFLQAALRQRGQKDDITIVAIRRVAGLRSTE